VVPGSPPTQPTLADALVLPTALAHLAAGRKGESSLSYAKFATQLRYIAHSCEIYRPFVAVLEVNG